MCIIIFEIKNLFYLFWFSFNIIMLHYLDKIIYIQFWGCYIICSLLDLEKESLIFKKVHQNELFFKNKLNYGVNEENSWGVWYYLKFSQLFFNTNLKK